MVVGLKSPDPAKVTVVPLVVVVVGVNAVAVPVGRNPIVLTLLSGLRNVTKPEDKGGTLLMTPDKYTFPA